MNTPIGRIAGILLTVDYTFYKRYHLKHHAELGGADDPELPVELRGIGSYISYLSPRYFLLPFWNQQLRVALGGWPDFIQSARMRRGVRRDNLLIAVWAAAITGLLMVWPRGAILYYLLPLWVAPAWMFLTTVPEHYRLRRGVGVLTRTVISGPLISFFLWNTNHHVQHHENPALPFEDLPHVRTRWPSDQAEVSPCFTAFHLELLGSFLRTSRAA